jgi:glycosyltransferase involved in cell wall biosynthesis
MSSILRGEVNNFSMPLVTVIINVLNGAATLTEAIDSVLGQTFDDWELIVWDDYSTDGSASVLAGYTDRRIRYISAQVRVPLGHARQQAIDLARGEWIAFLDQDDLWLPEKLERQMALACGSGDAALIYGRTVRFYPGGTERDYDQAHEYSYLPEGDIFTELFTNSCFIAMSSAVFRRSALREIGGIPNSITIIPDYYLYTSIARRFPAAAVQEAVCRYRMHPGNTSRVTALQVQQEALRLMDTWQGAVAPEVLAQCRKRHSTAIALLEMRRRRTLVRGTWRLLSQGSLLSQLLRPFYFVFHVVRRTVRPALWKTLNQDASSPHSRRPDSPQGRGS